jgi:hypothetical protein
MRKSTLSDIPSAAPDQVVTVSGRHDRNFPQKRGIRYARAGTWWQTVGWRNICREKLADATTDLRELLQLLATEMLK